MQWALILFLIAGDAANVAAVFEQLHHAGLKRDVATLEKLYAPEYVHTNADGSVMTRADVLASYRKPGPAATAKHVGDVWQVDGNCALLTTRIGRFRVTYRFEKRNGAWLAVESRAALTR